MKKKIGEHRIESIILELISNVPNIIRYNLKYLHDNTVYITEKGVFI